MNAEQVVKWLLESGFTREADRVTSVLAAEAALAPPPKSEPEVKPEAPADPKPAKSAAKPAVKKAKAK